MPTTATTTARATTPRRKRSAKIARTDPAAAELATQLAPGFPLTHLDKLLYPEQGLSKAHLITYYAAVAPFMLPHVVGRPLTLLRCPDGSDGQCFYQKHIDRAVPDAVKRVPILEAQGQRGTYGYIEDMSGLIALAQLGALEVHVWNSRVAQLERPDQLVFDLDPAPGLPWTRVVQAALSLRERLSGLGLISFVKTSGGKGLHVVAPIAPELEWEQLRALTRGLALQMAQDEPKRYVVDMRKSARTGKIFLDYLRNTRGASAVAPYSTRANARASIATPVHWDELQAGVKPETFDLRGVVRRLERPTRDPWAGFHTLSQRIAPRAVRSLVELAAH
jgi:bifunctional non-homologous end joining protein LigD